MAQIYFTNGNKIEYLYDANGTKIKKRVTEGSNITETLYNGTIIYKKEPSQSYELDYIITEEGRLTPTIDPSVYKIEYYLKDLPIIIGIGNVRAILTDSETNPGTPELIQESHYYPFGQEFMGMQLSQTGDVNNYKYNGKELQTELGLNWYDYGARFYDAALGRFHTVDPALELARSWTPFQYSYSNPIRYIDRDGMVVDDIYNYSGKYMGSVGSGSKIRIMNHIQSQFNTMKPDYIMKNSKVVTVETAASVNNKLQGMSKKTNSGSYERKAYVVLNTEKATLTLEKQPKSSGDNKHNSVNEYEGVNIKMGETVVSVYKIPKNGEKSEVIVGQVHTHNKNKSSMVDMGSTGFSTDFTEVKNKTSDPDKEAAIELEVPVNAIDGNTGEINRVNPDGSKNKNVDSNKLLQESLEISGGKR